jgi:transcription termination/antitermination protein NusG
MEYPVSAAWYALRVKSNCERVTAAGLLGKGFEVFLPEYQPFGDGSARQSLKPLFPGYLFSRFDINNRLPVLIQPGLLHIVGCGKQAIPVDDHEIESLKIVMRAGLPVQREDNVLLGQQVRIEKGALAGAEGTVVGLRSGQRLLVAISLLQRSVSVMLERDAVGIPMREKANASAYSL